VTEEQRKGGPPRRAGRFWAAPAVAYGFHTPGMRALRSSGRSKIISANCTGYVVTDPGRLWRLYVWST